MQGGCKQACRVSTSYLARRLQAGLQGVYKPACRGCARKGAFPEAVVGANDYSPLREGYVHLIYTRPLVSMRTNTLSACAQTPCQHARKHLVSMRTNTLSACAQTPCQHAHKHLVSMRANALSACAQAPCQHAHKPLVLLHVGCKPLGRVSSLRRERCLHLGVKRVFT